MPPIKLAEMGIGKRQAKDKRDVGKRDLCERQMAFLSIKGIDASPHCPLPSAPLASRAMRQSHSTAYAPHETLVAPARAYPQLWRLILGLVLTAALYMILGTLLFTATLSNAIEPSTFDTPDPTSSPSATLALLMGFGFMVLGTAGAARLLHKRGVLTLLGPARMALSCFSLALVATLGINLLVFVLPPYALPELVPNLPVATWFSLLFIAVPALLLQVSAEEVLFRGYIQQQLAARFQSPLIWMVLPSALFGLAHYTPAGNGENAWLVVLWAFGFGLFAADLTARTGNLGAAIGLHFVNNAFSILLISPAGPLSGLALYRLPFSLADLPMADPLILIDLAVILCSWLAIRIALKV